MLYANLVPFLPASTSILSNHTLTINVIIFLLIIHLFIHFSLASGPWNFHAFQKAYSAMDLFESNTQEASGRK